MILSSDIDIKIRQSFYLREVIRVSLKDIEFNGIPEAEFIKLDFIYNYPGVNLPENKFSEDLSVNKTATILFKKDQFFNLKVNYLDFSVNVSVENITYCVTIPFASIIQYENTIQQISLEFDEIPYEIAKLLVISD